MSMESLERERGGRTMPGEIVPAVRVAPAWNSHFQGPQRVKGVLANGQLAWRRIILCPRTWKPDQEKDNNKACFGHPRCLSG